MTTETKTKIPLCLVAQLCPTLCDPMDCSPPGSSVHGILEARILEWVAISFSRGSSWPRDWTLVSCIAGGFFTVWITRDTLTEWLKSPEKAKVKLPSHWKPWSDPAECCFCFTVLPQPCYEASPGSGEGELTLHLDGVNSAGRGKGEIVDDRLHRPSSAESLQDHIHC